MTARIQNATSQPDITAGVQHLFKAAYSGGVPRQTLELVHLRVSQINGCSACVDAGAASAAKAGVSSEKLLTVAAWYENPLFDAAERAALALAEAATRLADRPGAVTNEIWAAATKQYRRAAARGPRADGGDHQLLQPPQHHLPRACRNQVGLTPITVPGTRATDDRALRREVTWWSSRPGTGRLIGPRHITDADALGEDSTCCGS